MTYDPAQREGRFASGIGGAGMGSDFGYDDVARQDPLNQKYIRRNLREYSTLKKFGKKGGLRKLRGRNTAQLERLAVQAVLKKNNVKRRKLRTSINRSAHNRRAIALAKKRINQGYDIRKMGQTGKSISQIKNKKVRKAAKHIATIRRNRAIMKTPLMAGQGYNIRQGHTSLATARRRNYWRRKKKR